MEPCQIDVAVIDGSTVLATHTGNVILLFTSDQGKEAKLSGFRDGTKLTLPILKAGAEANNLE
eukprot:2654155-Ditylum_brightwellii.AAC.1